LIVCADALGLASGTKIVDGQTVLVEQPPVFIGGQVWAGWEF
jgi:hypothetical protein